MKIPYDLNPFGVEAGGKPDLTKDLLVYVPLDQQYRNKDIINNKWPDKNPSSDSKFYTIDNVPGWDMRNNQNTGYLYYLYTIFPSFSSTNLTFSFWFKLGEIYNGAGIFYFGGSSASNGSNIKLSVNNLLNVVISLKTSSNQTYTLFEADKKWHNYTISLTPTSISFYLDGTLKLSESFNSTDWSNSGGNKVLNLGLAGTNYFSTSPIRNASSSSLRMYTRNLSIDEISLLAAEFTPIYEITASDQTLSGFNPAQVSTKSITYTCSIPISFEIISGDTLPNTITFNTSTGKFTGKALSDADHTYNLAVRMSGQDVVTKEINVTIKTSATSTLTVPSPQSFSYITEASASKNIEITTQAENPTVTIASGTLPTGVSLTSNLGTWKLVSTGTQTSNESSTVQIAVTTTYHQTPVYATLNVDVTLNQITVPDRSINFYIDDGSASKQVEYTTQNTITPVYSLSGTLPNGITFDSSTGIFTYDGVYDTPTSGEVNVIVNSSTGCSAQGVGKYTFEIKSGSMPVPDDYSFYAPLQDLNETEAETGQQILDKTNMTGLLTAQTFKGVPCIHTSASSYEKRWWRYDQTGIAKQNEARTISIWVYLDNSNSNVIFAYGQTGSSPGYGSWVRLAPDSLDLAHFGFAFSNFTAQLNTWYHYVVTIDATKHISLYINGTFIQTGTTSSMISTSSTGGLYVFGNNWNDGWSAGYFSSLRIYNRVLTQAEITKLSQEFTPTE